MDYVFTNLQLPKRLPRTVKHSVESVAEKRTAAQIAYYIQSNLEAHIRLLCKTAEIRVEVSGKQGLTCSKTVISDVPPEVTPGDVQAALRDLDISIQDK